MNRPSRIVPCSVVALALAFAAPSLFAQSQDRVPELLTVAETSEFKQTSTSAEVAQYVEHYAAADHVESFVFGKTNDGRDLVGVTVSKKPFRIGDRDDRLRILLLGNIHSGECSGKEALLMILRTLSQKSDHPWLENLVIVMVPNYNADGNDRMGLNHRPGQVGPERGMGLRENAQHLDLNRDFGKLESPEARALIGLFDRLDSDVFVDCHTTDGSLHRYGVTYDVPHNPSSPQTIRDYMRKVFMPAVTDRLEKAGLSTFYYGNFNADKTEWETYGHEPRYSTEYVGLRGRLAILCEDYSHNPYKTRVLDSQTFVSALLDYCHENAAAIRDVIASSERDFIHRASDNPSTISLSLDAKVRPFADKFRIKSFDDNAQPKDFEVAFIGDYAPVKTALLPYAYVIPLECSRQVDRLRMHGVKIQQASADASLDAEIYTINSIKRAASPFQRHAMVAADATSRSEARTIRQGDYLVETAQPLGRLIFYLLEPMSNDGLVTWNFFDPILKPQSEYPIWRINEPVSIPTTPVTTVAPADRLTLEMIFGTEGPRVKSPPRPRWQPSGKSYLIEWDGRPVQVDAESGALARNPANDKSSLRSALQQLDGLTKDDVEQLMASSPKPTSDESQLVLVAGKNVVRYDPATKKASLAGKLGADADLFQIGPTPTAMGIVAGNNLYCGVENGLWQITDDGDDNHLNGKLDWVYQEELYGRGTFEAFWFSPNAKRVAFLRFDETDVPRYTVTNHSGFRSADERTLYPNAGDPLPRVTLAVADSDQRKVLPVDLQRYAAEPILITSVGWDKSGERVIFSVQDRGQTWLELCAADPTTGASKVLLRETSVAWIRTPGQPVFLDDGSFCWLSTRTGFSHIYHASADGTRVDPVTEGEWQVSQLQGASADNRFVFFTGLKDSPFRTQLYRVELANGEIVRLTDPEFDHAVDFNSTKDYFFDSASNASTNPVIDLRTGDGKKVRSIWKDPNDSLAYYAVQAPEFVQVPTRDGGFLDAILIRPPDFDESKKYPVIAHVYGGPQSPTVRDQFRGATYLWHQLMAQHGFVIWICDNRSASRRALKPAWGTHGKLGANELIDIEEGLNWLSQKPWIDQERIGIWGWSYGGFMTAYAMTHSSRFKAGMAGAPVTDWRNYDAIYTERLMKLPENNAEGYDASSVVKAAGSLHGKLFLVHGTMDDNVHMSNTLQLLAALQTAQKPVQLMLYPGSRHGVQDAAQELHLWRAVTEFFEKNL